MRSIRVLVAALVAASCATRDAPPPPVSESAPVAAATPVPPAHPWPGGDRADLVVPDEVWDRAMTNLGRPGGKLGFTADEMNLYKGDRYLLRTVGNLFRDVRGIPRFSGMQAKAVVKDAANAALLVERAYVWADVRAGRMLSLPKPEDGWGVDWIPKGTSPRDAIDSVLARGRSAGGAPPRLSDDVRRAWTALPERAQRLVVRLFVAIDEARPWVQRAFDAEWLAAAAGTGSDADRAAALYRLAVAPLTDERYGLSVTPEKSAFDAISHVDREYLALGSVVLTAYVNAALDEFRAATGDLAGAAGVEFATGLGVVRVFGSGNDVIPDAYDAGAVLTVDLGGDDRYSGRQAAGIGPKEPIGLLVDVAGNDTYDSGDAVCSLGAGLFGVGALFDLGGNDRYRVKESGIGCGWFGTGLVADSAGDDAYVVDTHWGQACAHVGAGLLVDLAGNDAYTCGFDSQSHAGTLGATLLLDVAGNDRYLARDDGNISELYLGQSVAMSQGCGQGRRADLGDGHSMAGGIAFLVDGAGDDEYHATAWSQGCAYWWSAGFLEDLGGNDTYRNGKYSSGAAAHFAIGLQADLDGDDAYNVGNDATKNQFQGHARDGSIGISIDGDGNDRYKLTTMCGGAADLTSIGILWDRRGDDVYELAFTAPEKADGWADTPPLGTSSLYPRSNDFRDDVDAWGLYLDTGGTDRYEGPDLGRRDGADWPSHRGPRSWGYGLDVEWYAPAGR